MAVLALLAIWALSSWAAPEVRVGDVATVLGLQARQLVGVGLVTGLAGRGDSPGSALVAEALRSVAGTFGLEVSAGELKSRNCAAVLVTAATPSFLRAGDRMNVDVSSIGDAKGIEDGVLLATVLRDASGVASAVAQGRLQVGADARTKTVASIPLGAVAQRAVLSTFSENGVVSLVLRHPDFATAQVVQQAVKSGIPGVTVGIRDAALVEVQVPADRRGDVAAFVAQVQSVRVKPEPSSRVVVDAARGVVVVGENVRIGRVAVAYRRLSVSVGLMGFPVTAGERKPETFLVDEPATVADLVSLLQALELTAVDIIGILQAIDQAGALYGALVVL